MTKIPWSSGWDRRFAIGMQMIMANRPQRGPTIAEIRQRSSKWNFIWNMIDRLWGYAMAMAYGYDPMFMTMTMTMSQSISLSIYQSQSMKWIYECLCLSLSMIMNFQFQSILSSISQSVSQSVNLSSIIFHLSSIYLLSIYLLLLIGRLKTRLYRPMTLDSRL